MLFGGANALWQGLPGNQAPKGGVDNCGFIEDLLAQEVGTPLEGDGGRQASAFSLLGVVRRCSDNCLRPARCWTIE